MSIKKISSIGLLTSGGDAPGMNAAIRAVVRSCVYYNIDCYGIRKGYDGLIKNDIVKLDARSVRNIINTGGTVLKTARSKEFRTVEGRKTAYQNLLDNKIDALIAIGGDGTFTGANVFSQEYNMPVIGIPGTIDNDIYGTDFTLGYDTALNTVVEAIDKIRDTASSHSRLFFIEVMGRDAGFLAVNSGIGAGAEDILIPEADRGIEYLLESLNKSKKSGKSSNIVVVAEGNKSGGVYTLLEKSKDKLKDYDIRVTVLGHIQRGGSPSCSDRVLASRLGLGAVEGLLEGKSNVMVGLINSKLAYTSLDEAVKTKHDLDKELLRIADIVSI